jgi:hypothetical protein
MNKLIVGAFVLPLVLGTSSAMASLYSFSGVNSNEVDVSSQLSLDVTQVGSSVDFKFTNALGGVNVFIGTIYFDFLGTNLFSSLTQTDQSGTVSFTGVTPSTQNFPEGNTIGFTTNAEGDRNGGAVNGVNLGEYLTLAAVLNSTANIDDLLANGGLRVGLHIQGYQSGGSDSYVNTPPTSAVPIPAAGWLLGSALVGLMGLRRRKL